MKPYRVAIIETGNTTGHHVKALQSVQERAELVAVMDVDEATCQSILRAAQPSQVVHKYD